MSGFIYFMRNAAGDKIRIGYSRSPEAFRTEAHEDYGYRTLGVIRGSLQHETLLHKHYKFCAAPTSDRDSSHYLVDDVRPYVERLLEYHYAVESIWQLAQVGQMPWTVWRPVDLVRPLYEGDQGCFYVTASLKSSMSDTYQTPTEEVELCRAALGGEIDLDPASSWEANSMRIKAKYIYTEFTNGLRLPWCVEDSPARVFLNPPYGEGVEAAKFVNKLVEEIKLGNVSEAITVLNLQSSGVNWFRPVWDTASAHAIYNKRINFIGAISKNGKGPGYTSAKNGTIFSYFGNHADRFYKVFGPVAVLLPPAIRSTP